jgi:hypothetical protein
MKPPRNPRRPREPRSPRSARAPHPDDGMPREGQIWKFRALEETTAMERESNRFVILSVADGLVEFVNAATEPEKRPVQEFVRDFTRHDSR